LNSAVCFCRFVFIVSCLVVEADYTLAPGPIFGVHFNEHRVGQSVVEPVPEDVGGAAHGVGKLRQEGNLVFVLDGRRSCGGQRSHVLRRCSPRAALERPSACSVYLGAALAERLSRMIVPEKTGSGWPAAISASRVCAKLSSTPRERRPNSRPRCFVPRPIGWVSAIHSPRLYSTGYFSYLFAIACFSFD